MEIANGVRSTTTKVWEILTASNEGNLLRVKALADECYELIYAQYNYAPPVHFAVREGHLELVKYLLYNGAHDPHYKIYPFSDDLQTIAFDRNYEDIALMLEQYTKTAADKKFKGDNGKIHFDRTPSQYQFEVAVSSNNINRVAEILNEHPEYAKDETFFWGEGILMMPAKENRREMIDLLMSYEAKVPDILKWTQFYYFKSYEGAAFMMERGMNPNVMSWHCVTLLHDMAQKGDIQKAELLIKYGAHIDPVDEEYQSTPLGLAARWGQVGMVEYLLKWGADPNKSGAAWATPLAWAKKKGFLKIEKILRDAGSNEIKS